MCATALAPRNPIHIQPPSPWHKQKINKGVSICAFMCSHVCVSKNNNLLYTLQLVLPPQVAICGIQCPAPQAAISVGSSQGSG